MKINKIECFRCGALSIGDQILSIDDTVIENTTYTPEDVMSFLNGPSDRGFTQLQILPVHAIQRKGNSFDRLLFPIISFGHKTKYFQTNVKNT